MFLVLTDVVPCRSQENNIYLCHPSIKNKMSAPAVPDMASVITTYVRTQDI